jgi:hypothetical protein
MKHNSLTIRFDKKDGTRHTETFKTRSEALGFLKQTLRDGGSILEISKRLPIPSNEFATLLRDAGLKGLGIMK